MTTDRLVQFHGEDRSVLFDLFFGATQPTVSNTKANTQDYSYRLDVSAFGYNVGSRSAIRVGYWLNHVGMATNGRPQLFIFGSGKDVDNSPLIRVEMDQASGAVRVMRATATGTYETLESVSVPTELSLTDTWKHLGCTYYSHATLGFLTVYLSGNPILELVGDTRLSYYDLGGSNQQEFTTTLTHFWVGGRFTSGTGAWNSHAYLDDLLADSYDSEEDASVPTRRFMWFQPTGAGADAAWTPNTGANYAAVDEAPKDDDVTYNKALSAGLKDTFAIGDITLPADHVIVATLPTAIVKRLDSTIASTLKLHFYDLSTYDSSDALPLSTSYEMIFQRFTAQPDSSAWNETDFNAMQAGYESAGSFA